MTRGYQMRRHARRMRRYGLQPMIFISPGDRLPETAAMVLARLAWRYRSELVPLALGVLLALAGWLLHVTHPGWWLAIAAISAVTAAGPFAAGPPCWLSPPARQGALARPRGAAGGRGPPPGPRQGPRRDPAGDLPGRADYRT